MSPRPPAGRPLARRALLAGGLAGFAGTALAACSGAAPGPSARAGGAGAATVVPSADAPAVQRARAAAAGLAAAADRLAAGDRAHAALLHQVAADHRIHLAALGALGALGPAGAASPAPSPATSSLQPAAAVGAEWDAATAALDDVQHVSAPVAAVLARIAAACAGHADLLAAAARVRPPGPLPLVAVRADGGPGASTPPSPGPRATASGALPTAPAPAQAPSPASAPVAAAGTLQLAAGARDALAALTAGEHAAVFAYGLIAARAPQARRGQARAAWSWHLACRDLLEERLLAAGVQPPAAAPAYSVGGASQPSAAVRLAATVERRLGALAVRAVAATEGDDRRAAATTLVEGARRLAGWTGRPETLPG